MKSADLGIPKAEWPAGPWQDEPDRVDFEHAGFACLAHRNRVGVWCGYVAVPPGHPAYGLKYEEIDVEVHGSLTYSDKCHEPICHTAKPGEPDEVWWLGFDCAHAWDLCPGMIADLAKIGMNHHFEHEVYRDLAYVKAEIESLAEQLGRMATRK